MANGSGIKPYSELAHIAALHGGPQEYIDIIANANFFQGFNAGRWAKGSDYVVLVCGTVFLWEKLVKPVASKITESLRKSKEEELQQEEIVARNAIVETLENKD